MRKAVFLFLLLLLLVQPVSAQELTAPEVPETAKPYLQQEPQSFGEGLWEMLRAASAQVLPALHEASRTCLGAIAAVLLASVLRSFHSSSEQLVRLACGTAVAAVLMGTTHSLIGLGVQTVEELSTYGKLLLPVMTSAMAAQGGVTTATALYTGTAVFNTVLSSIISGLLIPLVYVLLTLASVNGALGEPLLKKLLDFVKWLLTWLLRTILYCFTGYMGITGVVSGSVDAAAIKATRLTISGVVPVVGGILSDASEAVLVGAGLVKNSVGVYGLLAGMAVCIGPFLKIGAHYLTLKFTAAVCGVFDSGGLSELIKEFSSAMGLLLAMTGTVCLLLMISTICFMKGMSV